MISVGLHRLELEENIQSQAEHQTEETEGCELCRVAAGNEIILQFTTILGCLEISPHNTRSGLRLQGAGHQVV